MDINHIIDVISYSLREGTLVLHKSLETHPKFKVYKTFSYKLYKLDSKGKALLITYNNVVNTSLIKEEDAWRENDDTFLKHIIDWLSSDEFKSMKNGTK